MVSLKIMTQHYKRQNCAQTERIPAGTRNYAPSQRNWHIIFMKISLTHFG